MLRKPLPITLLIIVTAALLWLSSAVEARLTARAATSALTPVPAPRAVHWESNEEKQLPTPPLLVRAPSKLEPQSDPIFRMPNMRANNDPTTYAQQEPSIAINPTNPLNIISSAKDERRALWPGSSKKEVWQYASFDGGKTWTNSPSPIFGFHATHQSDPVNLFRDDGRAYACYLAFGSGSWADTGIQVAQSLDGGATWISPTMAVSANGVYSTDKQWFAVDNNPASPFYHRMYLSWTDFGVCPGCIHHVYSADGGLSWSSPQRVGINSNEQFSMPTVLPNGDLIVSWIRWTGGSWLDFVYRRSSDGGLTFGPEQHIAALNYLPNPLPGNNWRVTTMPILAAADDGTLVGMWADDRNADGQDADIYAVRSADNGATWTEPARVNDDALRNFKHQHQPWVTSSPNGVFHAIWYDGRDDPGSPNVNFHIYYASSSDGGLTWSPNVRASDAASNLNVGIPQGPGWNAAAGDYIQVAATDEFIYGAWTDTRSGIDEDIYVFRAVYTPTATTPTPPVTGTPPTATATRTHTSTPAATVTATRTAAATATAIPCSVSFSDVRTTDYFYEPVRYLTCRDIVSGYSDGSFRPYSNVTRAQLIKMVVLAEGWQLIAPAVPTFGDVRPGDWFYGYVETAADRQVISGYEDGTFRPYNDVTRGQIAKVVVIAAGWQLINPSSPTFEDVGTENAFYTFVETAHTRGIISGYDDGTFRWGNPATRGQVAKIVHLSATAP